MGGINQCLHQAERKLRIVQGNWNKHSDVVHEIHNTYTQCNLNVCEQFCGEGTGNEKHLPMCKIAANILLQDLHNSHHEIVHGQDEYVLDQNAEFGCRNFRFWQEKHMKCVPAEEVSSTFYDSLGRFLVQTGKGFSDQDSQ